MQIALNVPLFRSNFTAYADEVAYPDMRLEAQYEVGKCYIADNSCTMADGCLEYALQMMLAHLLIIQDKISSGAVTSIVTSANEGAVSVSLAQPPSSDSWSYWLNTTPYGMQLLSMLSSQSVGGFYVGGSPERRGFRKINGGF